MYGIIGPRARSLERHLSIASVGSSHAGDVTMGGLTPVSAGGPAGVSTSCDVSMAGSTAGSPIKEGLLRYDSVASTSGAPDEEKTEAEKKKEQMKRRQDKLLRKLNKKQKNFLNTTAVPTPTAGGAPSGTPTGPSTGGLLGAGGSAAAADGSALGRERAGLIGPVSDRCQTSVAAYRTICGVHVSTVNCLDINS